MVAGGYLLKTHDIHEIHGSLKHPLDPLEAPLPASTGRRELWALHLPARPQLEKSPLCLRGVMGMFRPWVANLDQLTVTNDFAATYTNKCKSGKVDWRGGTRLYEARLPLSISS